MSTFLAVLAGIIGFSLIERYKGYVGGWWNAYFLWIFLVFVLFISWGFYTGDITVSLK